MGNLIGGQRQAITDYNRGIAKFELGDYAGAVEDFDRAIALDANWVSAYNNRGVAKLHLGNYAEAVEDYDRVIALDDSDTWAYHNRGLAKLHLGNYAEAVEDFDRAIALDANWVSAYNNRGIAKSQLGNCAGAIADYNRVIALDANLASAYNNRGIAKLQLGDYAGAITDYNRAIALDNSCPLAYNNLGFASEFKESAEAAKVHYTNAGEFPVAQGHLARLNGLFEQAIGYYMADFPNRIRTADSFYGLGYCYTQLEDYENALNALNRCIELAPRFIPAYQERADVYRQQGNIAAAEGDLLAILALERQNNPAVHLYLAIRNNQKTTAFESLRILRNQHPEEVPATFTTVPVERREPALLTLARFGRDEWLTEFLKYLKKTQTDEDGNTALHLAAAGGHEKMFLALCYEGLVARVGGQYQWARNHQGQTPLQVAALAGQTNLILSVIQKLRLPQRFLTDIPQDDPRAPINFDSLIHCLVRGHRAEALRELLKHCQQLPLNAKNHEGYDPLMLAILENAEECIQVLLKGNVDLFNRDAQGQTALHLAVQKNSEPGVRLLLDKGARLDVKDTLGRVPAEHARKNSLVDVLLANHSMVFKRNTITIRHHQFKNLVFEGGSVKGLAYPAALSQAEQSNLLDLADIERVGGSSAGAITALLIGLGYGMDEMNHIAGIETLPSCDLPQVRFSELLDGEFGEKLLAAKNRDWDGVLGSRNAKVLKRLQGIDGFWVGVARVIDGTIPLGVPRLARKIGEEIKKTYDKLGHDFGLCPGDELRQQFDEVIRRKYSEKVGIPIETEITFSELAEYEDFKKLYFIGVNCTTGEAEIFSAEHTPDMVVADAVRISMAIPGVFYPHPKVTKDSAGNLHRSEALYVDGGLVWNYPVTLFDYGRYIDPSLRDDIHQINSETLGFRLVSQQKKRRYEHKPLKKNERRIETFWDHIKALVRTCYLQNRELNHAHSGDQDRTVYIDTKGVGMLDFERVEEPIVISALQLAGREGVEDFCKRTQDVERPMHVALPDELQRVLGQYMTTADGHVATGSTITHRGVVTAHPEIVYQFYRYRQEDIHAYLNKLNISVFVRDERGNTAFHLAAYGGDKRTYRRLCRAYPTGDNMVNDRGITPQEIWDSKDCDRLHEVTSPIPSSYCGSNTVPDSDEENNRMIAIQLSTIANRIEFLEKHIEMGKEVAECEQELRELRQRMEQLQASSQNRTALGSNRTNRYGFFKGEGEAFSASNDDGEELFGSCHSSSSTV